MILKVSTTPLAPDEREFLHSSRRRRELEQSVGLMCADKKISINIDTHSQEPQKNFLQATEPAHTIHIEILIIPNPPRKKKKEKKKPKSGLDELLLLFYFIMFSSSREYLWNC